MAGAPFDLVECMAFDPHAGLAELDRHLARMKRSADELGFPFDRHEARNELQAATFRAGVSRVRLLLSRSGAMAIELRPAELPPEDLVEVAVAPLPISSDDIRLRHKTTDRAFYDEARDPEAFETIFRDEAGFLTEGSFTNLFVERGGKLITPPLGRGLMPGILREKLIEGGKAKEGDLIEADLLQGFFLGCSRLGLVRAVLKSA